MTEKNKIYTLADFERYHAGAMPAIEMHELEKAALEDPFLADALEGYNYTPSFENDIAALHERLHEKRKEKKVFSISAFAQSAWWRIAAVFIIIAVSGYFFYRLNYRNKANTLAENDIKSLQIKQDSALLKKDTTTTNNIALEKHGLPADSFTAGSKKDYAYSEKNEAPENENDKNGSDKHLLKEKGVVEKEKALVFANVQNNSRDKSIEQDSIKFSTKSLKTSNATEDSQPAIAMNKSEINTLSSVGGGVETKKPATPPLANNEKFDQYLTENTQPVYDENRKLLTGEVVLSFTINKKGRPRNIKVAQSSCKDCEQEAVHLLENGPDWIVEKQKWKAVLIKF